MKIKTLQADYSWFKLGEELEFLLSLLLISVLIGLSLSYYQSQIHRMGLLEVLTDVFQKKISTALQLSVYGYAPSEFSGTAADTGRQIQQRLVKEKTALTSSKINKKSALKKNELSSVQKSAATDSEPQETKRSSAGEDGGKLNLPTQKKKRNIVLQGVLDETTDYYMKKRIDEGVQSATGSNNPVPETAASNGLEIRYGSKRQDKDNVHYLQKNMHGFELMDLYRINDFFTINGSFYYILEAMQAFEPTLNDQILGFTLMAPVAGKPYSVWYSCSGHDTGQALFGPVLVDTKVRALLPGCRFGALNR